MVRFEKLPEEQKVAVARKLYIAGFFLLPFMWIFNFLLFFPILKKEDTPQAARNYVYRGLGAAVIVTFPFIIWFIIFQVEWMTWGIIGERIAATLPKGGL